MMTRLGLLLLLVLACMRPAHAHKPSDSHLVLDVQGAEVEGRWDIALRDLDAAIGLDLDGDGALTWGEVRARHGAIAAYALSRLAVSGDGQACRLSAREQLVDRHTDGAYTVLRFHAACARPIRALDLDYRLLFDIDPQHKGLLRLGRTGTVQSAIFGNDHQRQRFIPATASRLGQFLDYLRNGAWHIWIGYDHILFLLSLLLPAVLLRHEGQWRAAPAFRTAAVDVVRIVTAFTLAHSLTLSLATLQLVSLPSRWVESLIAASVAVAALNNLWPLEALRRWAAAFVFGLLHGFGFASVLADLGLAGQSQALALVGFNVGVELGQLAIVALFLPLAYHLRATAFYRRMVLTGGSAGIALLAMVWLVERAFAPLLAPPGG
ncbi:HupE/UreJ family protein [Massilia sp. ZL223]|uniref:HupE/UreJ family protein n=1 Tax=Massilia sp. ZL223 TaxID=2824904 RepID=UPI0035A3AEBD